MISIFILGITIIVLAVP